MQNRQAIENDILALIANKLDIDPNDLNSETPLIGSAGLLSSMQLLELCLELEDKAMLLGFVFDWTSESAMSASKSLFKNAKTLAEAFSNQMSPAS